MRLDAWSLNMRATDDTTRLEILSMYAFITVYSGVPLALSIPRTKAISVSGVVSSLLRYIISKRYRLLKVGIVD